MFSEDSFLRRHKILTGLGVFVLLIVLFLGWRMKGPDRYYRVDFVKTGEGAPGVLEVGVAKRDITPNLALYDTFNDVNGNNHYDPSSGFAAKFYKDGKDTYNDVNKNGKFDPVWVAGFNSRRPAQGVHDPLWARAIAFRNNGVTVAMVTIDAIGLLHEKVIDIRQMIDPSLKIDHVIVSSTHNHETPDTMGNWSGPIPTPWSFDHANMARIKQACKEAVEEAVHGLQPVDMYCAEVELNPVENYIEDTRQPIVIDKNLRLMRFVKHGSDGSLPTDTVATFINWGNHPETMGGDNPLLTSDFCHYMRESMEHGVEDPKGALGLGGMCLYFQGPVGGLMTQLHITVPHRNGVDQYKEDSWEKTQALGENLALVGLAALRGDQAWKCENPRVAVGAKTIYAPMDGLFRYAIILGLIHPGVYWGFRARSEVDIVRIGDVDILTAPGELYPEIFFGGVTAPEGQDFPIQPVEVPPMREVMQSKMRCIMGLANDEVGYIVPKSQWDKEEPRAYKPNGQYGEDNSGGPEVAVTVHHESVALMNQFYDALAKVK